MIRFLMCLTLLLVVPMIFSCAGVPKPKVRPDPLIGKIVHTATHAPILFNALMDEIQGHDVIYLSEKHDNPMHHAIQHQIIQTLVERGRPPIVGFEFFSMEDTPLLLNFMDSAKADHSLKMEAAIEEQIRIKLGWDSQPDTLWAFYYDLLKLARDKGLMVSGLDLSSSQKRRVTRKGMEGLTPIEKKLVFSSGLSNEPYKTHMISLFKAVHCGMDHGTMGSRLYDTWVARNDKIALSITQLYEKNTPILVIIGGGHTEYGLGVMDRVKALNPELTQVNISMTEITREPSSLADYLHPLELEGFEPLPPSDFLWFTQRVSYQDPCEEFKTSLEKMKKKANTDP